jgi:hypothetical protein
VKQLKAALLGGVSLIAIMAACSQNSTTDSPPTTLTLADVQTQIKNACHFVPTISSIVAVASTVVTSIDPAAGAAATIAAAVGNTVAKAICDAVNAQVAASADKQAAPKPGSTLTVVVNGKPVTGTMAESK